MKLEILLKYHNIIWPEGATHAVQDEDGWIKFATNPNIKLLPNGCWDRGFCPQARGYVVPNLPLASDWNTAIVAKQNWIQITKEQIRSIPVGSPIRVGGTETILSYHYKALPDYGFDTKHVVQDLGGSTFGSLDWNKNIKVEVLMNQGHPHAESMSLYAEDAKTHAEPWRLWQAKEIDDDWFDCRVHPRWVGGTEYRHKPKTKLIHGVEIPDISFTPNEGETYITPSISHVELYNHFGYNGDLIDRHNLKHNLCYPHTPEGKQVAILHSKAMLGIVT